MISRIILPFAAALAAAPAAEMREVRIASQGTETEITVVLGETATYRHMVLTHPPRLLLDIQAGNAGLAQRRYEGINRGGVLGMRSTQFRPETVRLVFDLDREIAYRVTADSGAIRVTFRNPGPPFVAWSTTEVQDASVADMGGPAGPPPVVQATEPRISVVYDSASMLDVLAGFSEFADISVVPNGDVASVVVRGIDIRDQPWDVALNAILSAQNLGWHRTESGIIVVDWLENLQARDQLLSETRVIRVNYARADSVAETLRHLATPNRGQVVSFSGSNTVIVTDAPSVVARMDTIVAALDRRLPQVAIEAKIVFVDRTDVQQLGIVYDLKERSGGAVEQGLNDFIAVPDPNAPPQLVDVDGDGTVDQGFVRRTNETLVSLGGSAVAALANANDRPIGPALQILTAVAFGDFSLFSFLEALESHQLSDVQAAPSIRVVDHAHARIQVGERTPIRVLEPGAQTESARVNVDFEDTGIILDVVPHVTNNNQIRLELMAERSGLKLGLSDVGFVFEKQIGETTLLLDDGETAVIGGLTLSEVSRSQSGIPGLMNLPLIGNLFRSTKENEVKQDLIILVTPHIIHRRPEGR
ncbi:MAG: AMIN domain-containing protein [Gemmatimonadota bacterium]|uniref:secretin N-terminal domain-containing protein n=1 Tax=Candidatus Palauibacter scopulicola TaxID=3056741 RepID=UPI0023A054AA|nr:secretin N-terminal domain-containing protein [Candidatus Palauibacter scopulicola]MDE2663174.1 AMIN domain-containing protein [Candidatus Palauibacter scopulicola]